MDSLGEPVPVRGASETGSDGRGGVSAYDPIEVLMEEHRQFLDRLEGFAVELRRWLALPRIPPPGVRSILELAEFLAVDVDRWHGRKEEEFLFPAVGAYLPVDSGPVAMMIDEHHLVREEQRAIDRGGKRLENDAESPDALKEVGHAETRARTLLISHIAKEDQVLFPMVRSLLSPEEMERVARGFQEIDSEHGRVARR